MEIVRNFLINIELFQIYIVHIQIKGDRYMYIGKKWNKELTRPSNPLLDLLRNGPGECSGRRRCFASRNCLA